MCFYSRFSFRSCLWLVLTRIEWKWCSSTASRVEIFTKLSVVLPNALHSERPTTRKYIRDLIGKFTVTFSVKDGRRSGRPKLLNEDQEIDLLAEFVTNS